MSELDGLFENPNQSPENERLDTLNAIKDDTSEIREAIYKFGGKEIDLMRSQQALSKQQHKQFVKAQTNKTPLQAHTTEKNKHLKATSSLAPKTPRTAVHSPRAEQSKKDQTLEQQKQSAEKQTAQLKQIEKRLSKPIEAKLPNGWGYDKHGRIRDKFGKYVSQKELKKHGLQDKNRDTETEKEAGDRRLLDALSGIKDAVETPENFDPTLNAMQEISAPFKRMFEIGKAGVDAGRGMGKAFGDVKASRWRDRFSALFRKSQVNSEKQQGRMVDWLRKIWKKDPNSSSGLGKLLFFIPLLIAAFKSLIDKLQKFALFRGLMRLGGAIGGRIGWGKVRGGTTTADPNKKPSKLAKLGKFAKGALKRVPILGSLLAFNDGGMAGGIGSIVGAAIGSAFGPIGMIIGGLVGEKLGVWLADLDWSEVGKWISDKWQETTQFFSDTWGNVSSWFKETWEPVSKWFSEIWESVAKSITDKWDSVAKSFKETWDSIAGWFSDLVPDWVKDGASKAGDTISEAASSVGSYFSEKMDALSKWWNSDDTVPPAADLATNGVVETAIKTGAEAQKSINVDTSKMVDEQSKGNDLLGSMLDSLKNSYNLMKEKLDQMINGSESGGSMLISPETINAADHAVKNAAAKSLGLCATYVNNALRAQGISVHGHGKDVAGNLLKSNQGFTEVAYDENYVPQIGDVMSMPSNSQSDHNYGHVAIYTEQGWVSDFKQGNKYGNTAAANVHYYNEIKSGRIKPTIARKASQTTNATTPLQNMAQNASSYAKGGASVGGKFNGFGAEIDGYISESAQRYGVDEQMLRGLVKMEEGWTGKDSQTGAVGVGQFTRGTWNDLANTAEGKAIGMTMVTDENRLTANDPRRNNRVNTLATALLAKQNRAILERKGIAATGENLYMAHNMGAGFVLAVNGKGKFTSKTRENMDVNGGKGMTTEQFNAYQKGRFNKHFIAANGIKNNSSSVKKVAETYAPIPSPPPIVATNTVKIAETIAAEASKVQQQGSKEKGEKVSKTASVDPLMSLLTQDVSDRRIAHIVTGGIARMH